MNQSNILDMLRADPSIADDIPGFVKRMNVQDQKRTVRKHVEVIDEEKVFSLAEYYGGECTEDDVKRAIDALSREPLLQRTQMVYAQTIQAVQFGEVTTDSEAFAKALEISQIDPAKILEQ